VLDLLECFHVDFPSVHGSFLSMRCCGFGDAFFYRPCCLVERIIFLFGIISTLKRCLIHSSVREEGRILVGLGEIADILVSSLA
jgi:hypothetical protein